MSEENFDAHRNYLGKFLRDEVRYIIPKYQRKYSWEKEQVEELMDDLYEGFNDLKNKVNNTYFLGSIVEIKKEGKHEAIIVDGQQRITTIMILNLVLYRDFPYINIKTKDPWAIKKKNLESYLWIDEEKQISKLSIEVPEYMQKYNELLKIKQFGDIEQIKITNKDFLINYKNAALTIYNKLKDIEKYDKKNFSKFINYVYQNVNIVEIKCNNEAFAIKLFQILNDRGLDLKISDLLKVELKRKIEEEFNKKKQKKGKKINNEIIEGAKKEKERDFEAKWALLEKNINDIDLSFDNLLVIYEYYKLQSNPKISVWDNLKDLIKNEKDSLKIINEISEILDILIENVYSNSLNKVICGLNYIRWEMYVLTLIVTIKKEGKYEYFEDANDREKNERSEERVLKAIRRYYYLNWIAGKTANTIKETSFDLIKDLSQGKNASVIEEKLNKKLNETQINDELISKILRGNIRSERYLKPLLLMVEYEMIEDEYANFIDINRTLHLEHILPEEYAKVKDWIKVWKKEDADSILNTIGNFTLLNMKKNISAHNYKFSEKIPIYKGISKNKNLTGLTKFQITQKIVNDYEKNVYDKKWNNDSVNDRKIFLLGKIQKILDIKLLDKEEEKIYESL